MSGRGAHGFTLVELLVGLSLLSLVMAGAETWHCILNAIERIQVPAEGERCISETADSIR